MLVDRGEPGIVACLEERLERGPLVERPNMEKPCLPAEITRTPTPADSAAVSSSISPS